MICYVCASDNWYPVTVDRQVPGGVPGETKPSPIHSTSKIIVCKNCGNACHEVDVTTEEKLKDFYRKEYRACPDTRNLMTTTRKLNYVMVFLRDFLKDKKGLVIGDVGCATGYLVNAFRQLGHRATGSELTLTYRRFAEHYYGVPVTEELETKHRYDLIVIYHVLEHLMEPDKKLAH